MYKCSDCGKITDEKPQYCDCGNNVFIEVEPESGVSSVGKKDTTVPKSSPLSSQEKLSLAIFILCLVCAVIPWFFVLRPLPENEVKHSVKPVEVKKDIPAFETLWDDTPVKAAVQEPEPVVQTVEEPQTIIEYVTQIVQVPRQEPKAVSPAPKTQSKPKNTQTQSAAKPKTQSQTTNKPQSQNKPDVINRIEKNLSQNSGQHTSHSNTTAQNASKQQQTKPAVVKPKPTAEELAALNQYKNNLRMVLLSKLNVQSIIGEGDCDIEFAIDSNGKLINRKFARQSSNKTLNDAVYYMLMSVPVYQIPPKAYKGETIKLHFYINNGYYEISFK